MKDKLIVSMLLVLLLTVSFSVPVGVITNSNSPAAIEPESQVILSQTKTVLIDESHDPTAGFTHDMVLANMTTDLEAHGYSVVNMSSWSESMLFSADVVIIPVPTVAYSMEEYYALHHFVAKGGGLFIIADIPSSTTADELAGLFGFVFTTEYLQDHDDFVDFEFWIQWDRVSNFGNHPITEGVSNVTTFFGHGIRNYPGMGVPLLMMDADANSDTGEPGQLSCGTAAMVALEYQYGLGRLVVTGDSSQFQAFDITGNGIEEYYEEDNDLLTRNIIDWLASAPIPENIIVFDETHNSQQRIGTRTMFLDVVFDESHLATPFWGIDSNDDDVYGYSDDSSIYGDFAAYLEGSNIDVDKMPVWDYLTAAISDVLVVTNPTTVYSPTELDELLSLVREGLGLLLLGEVGTFVGSGAAQIADLFGVEFYDGGLNDSDDYYDDVPERILMDGPNLADHPSLNGVHEVGYIYGGGFRTVPDGAVTILSSDDDTSSGWYDPPPGSISPRDIPCGIAFQYGEGRVIMIADSNLFTNSPVSPYLEYGNNSLFGISAIRWLAEGKSFHSYWYGAQSLKDQGYGVIAMNNFSATFLEGSDALVLAAPVIAYSAAEKSVIDEYVTVQGNGLFLISETGTLGASIGDIANDYGIIFDSAGTILEDDDDYAHTPIHYAFLLDEFNIRTHAITEGVEGLLVVSCVGIGRYPDNAEVILEMDDDTYSVWSNGTPAAQVAMMVALETGNGRIVALGDTTFWEGIVFPLDGLDMKTQAIHELDNSRIMLNSMEWLIAGGGLSLPFNLPWWALPAIGVVIIAVVFGVGLRRRSGSKRKTTKTKSKRKAKTKTKTKKK